MSLRPLPTGVLIVLLAIGGIAGDARAQRNELPVPIITSSNPTAEQREVIKKFVESNVKLMETGDRANMTRARQALLDQVDSRDRAVAAVGFRLVYGEVAEPHLARIVGGPDEAQAINALIVAGGIATLDATGVLTAGRKDPRVAVRFAAFAASRRVFRSVQQFSPAIEERDAIDLVSGIGAGLAGETDAQVFDAGVRALLAAAEVQRQRFDRLPLSAWVALAQAVGAKVREIPCNPAGDSFLPSVHRAGAALGAAAARLQPQLQLDPAAARAVFEFGGDIWAHVLKRIEGGAAPPVAPGDAPDAADRKREQREGLATLVMIGRDLMTFGISPLTNAAVFEPRDPADWVREASPERDRLFIRRVRDLLGPGGIAAGPPLNYPPDRFIR